MKLDFKKLFLLLLPLFFLLPISAQADEQIIDGAVLYTYQSTATDGVSFLKGTNGIIYPKDAERIDKIFVFFHGINPPICTNCHQIDPVAVCSEFKLCEKVFLRSAAQENIAILIPQMDPGNGLHVKDFTKEKFDNYLKEALIALHSKILNAPLTISVAAGHGAGANIVKEYAKYYNSEQILIFDGCWASWCQEINAYVSGKKKFYIKPETENQVGLNLSGSNEFRGTFRYGATIKSFGADYFSQLINSKIPYVTISADHYQIPERCFLDYLTNDNCGQPPSEETPTDSKLDILLAEINAKKPKPQIDFPGLNFSDSVVKSDGTGTYVFIPWLAQFISALYKFGVGITSIIAVIIIILQGVRIIISGGGENKTEGYKKITHALIGLLIAWGSFAILYNINPKLTEFNALKVKVVERQNLPDFNEIQQTTDETIAPEDATEITNDTPKFTTCPITLSFPLETKAKLPNQDARTLEFYNKIETVITGQTQADRILQVADAATKCGVRFGSCGRTDGTIYSLAGVVTEKYPKTCLYTNGGCKTQENTKTVFGWPTNINNLSREQKDCEEICKNKGKECTDARTASTKKVMDALIYSLTEAKLTEAIYQLKPGDAFWIYNANGSVCRGNHAMIFDKWLSDGRAQVIQGMVQQFSTNDPKQRYSDGQVVYGAVCITQKCSDKFPRKPISRIFRPK